MAYGCTDVLSPLPSASTLCCGVAVTCLRAYGSLFCGSEGVIHGLTVATGIDCVGVHELLLAQRQHVFPVAIDQAPSRDSVVENARRRINVKVSAVMKNEN